MGSSPRPDVGGVKAYRPKTRDLRESQRSTVAVMFNAKAEHWACSCDDLSDQDNSPANKSGMTLRINVVRQAARSLTTRGISNA